MWLKHVLNLKEKKMIQIQNIEAYYDKGVGGATIYRNNLLIFYIFP